MLTLALPTSTSGRLEFNAFAVAPSSRRGRLSVSRLGLSIGHLNQAYAERLLAGLAAGQHDHRCAHPRRRAGAAILAALAAAAHVSGGRS